MDKSIVADKEVMELMEALCVELAALMLLILVGPELLFMLQSVGLCVWLCDVAARNAIRICEKM